MFQVNPLLFIPRISAVFKIIVSQYQFILMAVEVCNTSPSQCEWFLLNQFMDKFKIERVSTLTADPSQCNPPRQNQPILDPPLKTVSKLPLPLLQSHGEPSVGLLNILRMKVLNRNQQILGLINYRVKGPGSWTLQRGMLFGMVLVKRRVADQGVGPAGQGQSRARAERDSWSCSQWLSSTRNWHKISK